MQKISLPITQKQSTEIKRKERKRIERRPIRKKKEERHPIFKTKEKQLKQHGASTKLLSKQDPKMDISSLHKLIIQSRRSQFLSNNFRKLHALSFPTVISLILNINKL